MNIFPFRRPPRPPFKPGISHGDYHIIYVLPLLDDIERRVGVRLDSLRLRGGRWQALLASSRTWVFTDELIRGEVP